MSPFDFIQPLINLLKSDMPDVKVSSLKNLSYILTLLNTYFKEEIVGELWDMERFSLKEATHEPDIDKYTVLLWKLTQSIIEVEKFLIENPTQHWREIW